MKIEVIDWIDHHGGANDRMSFTKAQIIRDTEDNVVLRTYGELLYEDEAKVILVGQTRLDEDLSEPLYQHYMVIMKALIVKRTRMVDVS